MERRDPDFYRHLRAEFSDARRWLDRTIVLAYAVLAGAMVVCFTLLAEISFKFFQGMTGVTPWLALIWTPALTALLAWLTRRFFPRATGSGIPQVIASLDIGLDRQQRKAFVSLRLSVAKMVLASGGFLAGLSIGREGPSVQVAAGVMAHASRWFRHRHSAISPHALLVAGGAAGIAAAFNAPLAGVVFAIEELSNHMESRYSGVIISAIVLAGLLGVSAFGNAAYFGIITVPPLTWATLAPGLTVAIVTGLAGGLFAKLLLASLTGQSGDRITPLRQKYPVRFAAAIGFVIALIGLVSHGQTYGGGTEAARELLNGQTHEVSGLFGLLKFIATWLSAWSGVPGGLFAPSLSVGAGIGYNVSSLFGSDVNIAIVAMGMTGFLAAVTQAPLTAFIIVMEMIDGRPMVLSLMAVAMISATLSRMISRPLYHTLGTFMLAQFRAEQAVHAAQPETAETPPADAEAPPKAEASPETADAPQAASAGEPAAQEAGPLPQAGVAEAAAPQAMLPGMEAPTAPAAAAPDAVSDAASPPASSGPSPAAATPPPAAPSPQTPPSPPSP